MKVILCKPNMKPQVVDIPKKHTYLDIKALLEIESPPICVSRKVGSEYYDFWCDDEGLFQENKCMCGICTNENEILCGNTLIAKSDNEGNLVGLTEDEIKKVLDDHNFVSNEKYIRFCKERRNTNFLKDQDGNSLIIGDYIGFGSVYLNPMGYMLKYSI